MLIQYKTTKSRRHVSDRIGQALIDRGIAQIYQTREMRAAAPAPAAAPVIVAPYGFKKDGTPRLRPAPKKAEK